MKINHREFCNREFGKLSSWNQRVIFVRFKGPAGEACEPEDVSFDGVTHWTCDCCGRIADNESSGGSQKTWARVQMLAGIVIICPACFGDALELLVEHRGAMTVPYG